MSALPPRPPPERRPTRRHLGPPLLVGVCGLLVAGWFVLVYAPRVQERVIANWERELDVKADLLRLSIDARLDHALDEARLVAQFPSIVELLSAAPPAAGAPDHEESHVTSVLEGTAASFQLDGVAVLGSQLEPLLVAGRRPPLSRAARELAAAAWTARSPRIDLLPVEDGGPLRVCCAAPSFPAGLSPQGQAGGLVLTAFDPAGWLFPLLAAHHSASATSEAVLVRRERDALEFLSPLRLSAGLIQGTRRPARPELVGTAATAGVSGSGRYLDYRGESVLASTRPLENAPWGLVVKLDQREALLQAQQQVREAGLLGGLAALAAGGLFVALWWGQRQAAQAELNAERTRLAAVMERAWDPIMFLDGEGRVRGANVRAREVYGEDLIGRSARDLRAEPGPWPPPTGIYEVVHRDRNGRRIHMQISSSPHELEGEPVRVQVLRDVTERRAARERLERLARLYRALSEANEALVRASSRQEVLEVACQALVESQSAPLAWIGLREPDGQVRVGAAAGAASDYVRKVEVRWDAGPLARGPTGTALREGRLVIVDDLGADERMRPWQEAAAPLQLRSSAAAPIVQGEQVVGALNVYASEPRAFDPEAQALLGRLAADVGAALHLSAEREQRERADAALRERERFVRAVADTVPSGIYVLELTPEGPRSEFLNRRVIELLGYPQAELELRGPDFLRTLLHPDDAARLPDLMSRWQGVADGDVLETELRVRHASGEWRSFSVREVVFHRGPDGRVQRVLGAATDVTGRRDLQLSLRQLSRAVEQSPAAIMITDTQAAIEYVNPRFCELTGYTQEEVLGQTPRLLRSEETPPGTFQEMWRALESQGEWRGELSSRRRDGTPYWVELSLSGIRDDQGQVTHYLAVMEDVTGRRHATEQLQTVQQQFLHAQRLEALGRLAGGVAHDFNNLLTVIQGYSKLAMERIPAEHGGRRPLEQVVEASTRAAQLTEQLLAFGRKLPPASQTIDLGAQVRAIEPLLRPLLSEELSLVLRVPPLPLKVRIAPGQLQQVLLNLVANARDATPRGGEVTVEVLQVSGWGGGGGGVGPTTVNRLPETHAVLRVSDTGAGMDAPTLTRLFEPFFTTKEQGKGTGLGLATVWGIATHAGGTVTVESKVGQGSRFEVHLPLAKDSRPSARPEPPPSGAVPRGKERVLLVEDEPGVRELLQEALELWGYQVLSAADPLEALELWGKQRDQIDLVLSDVIMPHMSGPELVQRLREERPELRVLLMTGYAPDPELGEQVLHKPVMPEALARAVRAVLDGQPLPPA